MAHIIKTKKESRERRHRRIRSKISGTSAVPRVAVFRSHTTFYVQCIDDEAGKTLFSFSSKGMKDTPLNRAALVGKKIAEMAKEKHIESMVFDRGGFKYAGAVRAFAESLRAEGIKV